MAETCSHCGCLVEPQPSLSPDSGIYAQPDGNPPAILINFLTSPIISTAADVVWSSTIVPLWSYNFR